MLNTIHELTIMLAGEAGAGVLSTETILTSVMQKAGYNVFATDDKIKALSQPYLNFNAQGDNFMISYRNLFKTTEFSKERVFIFMQKNAPQSLNATEDLAILLSLSGK